MRDDEPEFHPPGHIHRVLSGMGAAVPSSLSPSPARMGRAAVKTGADADPPSSQSGVGAPRPLAAHHRSDARAGPSVLAMREGVNPTGSGKVPHRYHLLAPSDRHSCSPDAGLYR